MKIRITKEQAIILENLNNKQVLKITEEQYKGILKLEGIKERLDYPQITNSISKVSPQSASEFKRNVTSSTKIKGVLHEDLWKEFVNELYGLNESGKNVYEKLIKIMEACGYVENRKLSKSVFEGDKDLAKKVITSGLAKLNESGSPYMAMEIMENTFKSEKKNPFFKSFVDDWFQKGNENNTIKQYYDNGDYWIAWQIIKKIGNVGKSPQTPQDMEVVDISEIDDNLPMGTRDRKDAPWNEPDQPEDPMANTNKNWNVLRYDETKNYVILKDKQNGKSYALNVDVIPEDLYYSEEFGGRINLKTINSTDWKSIEGSRSKNIISNFVSNNLKELTSPENYGYGIPEELFMDGKLFVELQNSVDGSTANDGYGDISEYDDNLPIGTKYNPNAPWNDNEDIRPGYRPKNIEFNILANTGESAIFKKNGKLYYFDYGYLDTNDFKEYADIPRVDVGQDEDGMVDYEEGEFEITDETVENYLNDNINRLNAGYGYESWENGAQLVKIDEPMRSEILRIFTNNLEIKKALGAIDEVTAMGGSSSVFGNQGGNFPVGKLEYKTEEKIYEALNILKRKVIKENDEMWQDIAYKLGLTYDDFDFDEELNKSNAELGSIENMYNSDLHDDEEKLAFYKDILDLKDIWQNIADKLGLTRVELSKAIKNSKADSVSLKQIYNSDSYTSEEKLSIIADILQVDINPNQLEEVTSTVTAGNYGYDTPGFVPSKFMGNAGKKGKAPVSTKKNTPIWTGGEIVGESATDKTQWAGGAFVEFDDCTKLNNNKDAQNGGCSTGASDNVVKLKKTAGNVNAPSLGKKQ